MMGAILILTLALVSCFTLDGVDAFKCHCLPTSGCEKLFDCKKENESYVVECPSEVCRKEILTHSGGKRKTYKGCAQEDEFVFLSCRKIPSIGESCNCNSPLCNSVDAHHLTSRPWFFNKWFLLLFSYIVPNF